MKEIGLWIDRQEAIIVIFTGDSEEIKDVYADESDNFYDEVVSIVHDADSIRIFGPDEAKGELEKSLEREGVENVTVDTTKRVRDRHHI